MSLGATSIWFPASRTLEAPRSRLFCFPHGGVGASAFRDWQSRLGTGIEVMPAFLPGRERRITEPLVPSVEDLAAALVYPVLARAGERGYALLGHSMGALLSFELAHALVAVGSAPRLVVLSGVAPPCEPNPGLRTADMDDENFIDYVRSIGGTPAEVFDTPDLRKIMLPILRSDFEACENYVFRHKAQLAVPAIVFGGTEDPIAPAGSLDGWRKLFSAEVTTRVLTGDHFFLFDHLEEVFNELRAHLP